ncbi:MAG: hypothetical protein WBO54_12490, partial [Thermoanaerobaculia bacterium]
MRSSQPASECAPRAYTVRGESRLENPLGITSLILRSPLLVLETLGYGLYRVWGDRRDLIRILVTAARRGELGRKPRSAVLRSPILQG